MIYSFHTCFPIDDCIVSGSSCSSRCIFFSILYFCVAQSKPLLFHEAVFGEFWSKALYLGCLLDAFCKFILVCTSFQQYSSCTPNESHSPHTPLHGPVCKDGLERVVELEGKP